MSCVISRLPAALSVATLAALAVSSARADEHIFVYDAASPAAEALAETGLSFQFEGRPLGGYRLERIIQTGERGSAELRFTSDRDLGPGGLKAALGKDAPVGGLYEIRSDTADGQAFVGAVCPGAERAWLVMGQLRRFKDLPIQIIGKDPGAASARHCGDLNFGFRSELAMPPDREPPRQFVQVGHAP
jgi:hypothetical protein